MFCYIITERVFSDTVFGHLMAFVCTSPSYNSQKQISSFLDNQRKVTFLFIEKALEDSISFAISLLYFVNTYYVYIFPLVLKKIYFLHPSLRDSILKTTDHFIIILTLTTVFIKAKIFAKSYSLSTTSSIKSSERWEQRSANRWPMRCLTRKHLLRDSSSYLLALTYCLLAYNCGLLAVVKDLLAPSLYLLVIYYLLLVERTIFPKYIIN